jgi:ketosteroid isomerase-like protein
MSQEDVEIVRRALEASTAQPPDFEVVNALYHPDHVISSDWGVEARAYHGARGFAEFLRDMNATWQDWHQEIDSILDAGEKGVLVLVRLVARGIASGVPVEQPWAMMVTVRDGKLAESHTYIDRGEALKLAGLAE